MLLEYARIHQLDMTSETRAVLLAIKSILRSAKLLAFAQVKVPTHDHGMGICFVIAHNKTVEGMAEDTLDRCNGLQEVVGMGLPIEWYAVI
jgi:hypothetical protein